MDRLYICAQQEFLFLRQNRTNQQLIFILPFNSPFNLSFGFYFQFFIRQIFITGNRTYWSWSIQLWTVQSWLVQKKKHFYNSKLSLELGLKVTFVCWLVKASDQSWQVSCKRSARNYLELNCLSSRSKTLPCFTFIQFHIAPISLIWLLLPLPDYPWPLLGKTFAPTFFYIFGHNCLCSMSKNLFWIHPFAILHLLILLPLYLTTLGLLNILGHSSITAWAHEVRNSFKFIHPTIFCFCISSIYYPCLCSQCKELVF